MYLVHSKTVDIEINLGMWTMKGTTLMKCPEIDDNLVPIIYISYISPGYNLVSCPLYFSSFVPKPTVR